MKIRFLIVFAFLAATVFSPFSAAALQKQQRDKSLQAKATSPPAANVSKPKDSSKSNNSKTVEKDSSSAIERAVLDEINLLRKNPQDYIKYLEEYKKLFKGNTVYLPTYVRFETSEGTAAVDEAIEFLKTAPAAPLLSFSNGLNKAAAQQLADLIENSSLDHAAKDGSNLGARLAKYGAVGSKSGENISMFAELPRNMVLFMLVDDGVKSRMHRKNLLSPNFKVVGISYGKGKTGEGLCVLDFADSFNESIRGGTREL